MLRFLATATVLHCMADDVVGKDILRLTRWLDSLPHRRIPQLTHVKSLLILLDLLPRLPLLRPVPPSPFPNSLLTIENLQLPSVRYTHRRRLPGYRSAFRSVLH